MKQMSYSGLLILVLSVFFFISAASAACDLTGTWIFDGTPLVIIQSGNTVHGDYVDQAGKLDGILSGNTFTGTWSESPTYKGPIDAGKFVITISNDCSSFSGTWGYDQASMGGHIWYGTKKSGPTVVTIIPTSSVKAPACDMTGTWDFDGTPLVISQTGNTVHGDYVDQAGKLDGILSGNTFTGTWSESPTYTGPRDAGKFVLTLSSTCNSFSGSWGYDQASTGGHTWVGTKRSGATTAATTVTAAVTSRATTVRTTIVTTATVSSGSRVAAACDMTGTWDFDGTPLVITQSGNTVHGDYVDQAGKLDGILSGNTFTGTWSESPTYKGPRDAGKFVITLSSTCNSFSGSWGYDQASTGGHTWVGTKRSGATTTTVTLPGSGTTVASPCSGSGPSIYVEGRTMNPGQVVVIPIMMCNAQDIANMDLSVGYDSSALQFTDAIKGSLNSNTIFESNNVGSTVKIAFAGKSGFSGSGSIAILTFKVIGQNGASSPITVTVTGASTSGGKTVTIPINNGKISIGNTNPNDPGGRGKSTSLDALIALQISVGKRPNDSNYDVTKDGTVNSNDAREILKLAVQ